VGSDGRRSSPRDVCQGCGGSARQATAAEAMAAGVGCLAAVFSYCSITASIPSARATSWSAWQTISRARSRRGDFGFVDLGAA
jgi:hypothetical protein